MTTPLMVIAFDVDPASLTTFREALPKGKVQVIRGATAASLTRDWDLGAADLLVVSAHGGEAETLDLCRRLRRQSGRSLTPLLVLVAASQQALVRAALDAGAEGCLVHPLHVKQITSLLARLQESNQPGRHTLDLSRAQREDPWRDSGGEA